MIIGDQKILPGEEKKVVVNIANLPSRSSIDLSITINRSKKKGPVLLLMGGLHGDEINGIEIVRRMVERKLHVPIKGTVICIPILNVFGFIHFSRYVPDGKDVNRSFPGNASGSLAARMASYLTRNVLPLIDYGVDYHTGGAERTNYPQIRCMMEDKVNQKLAKAFHAPFTLDSPYRPKSLRQTAAKMGKHIIVFEGGESVRMDEFAISEAIKGTQRLMVHLGMSKEKVEADTPHRIIYRSSWIRAKFSGVFLGLVKNGQLINKNQIIGYISDPFGDFKHTIKSPVSGYLIGLNNNPVVHQGDALMHIGVM